MRALQIILPYLALLYCLFPHSISAQRPAYKINATLDTIYHTLSGTVNITYTNQADHPLDRLAIHLWPNAYKTRTSSLVKQKLHQGDLSLYRAREEELGGLYNLKFDSRDQEIVFVKDKKHIDIGWIHIPGKLQPGESIQISTPFQLKIPKSFSRIGRTGNAYQLTQWYPHIAVYDDEGWHAMPYLDQGEYFNDFADYDVTLHLPKSYKVAATGHEESAIDSGSWSIRTFKATNVIDFAWFASPSFKKETKEVVLENGSKVELNLYIESFLNEDWDSAMMYAERALRFYSDWVGPYPYPQMSVVHTPFSRAGFMEYPMVAQISYTDDPQLLDQVIAHEIGHTWLYGILASNERKSPWMDEGFNSLIEYEYLHTYYANHVEIIFPKIIHRPHSMDHYDALHHIVRSQGKLDPPQTNPEWQQNNQYVISAYTLPSQGLLMMKDKVGSDMMRKMMRDYFDNLKFSHVSPDDVEASFEGSCGCSLDWFFDQWIHNGDEVDYRITSFNPEKNIASLQNFAGIVIPVPLSEYSDGKFLTRQWIDGVEGEKLISLDESTDEVRLFDGYEAVNKKWWKNRKPRTILPLINLVPKIGSYDRPSMAFTPVIGYNVSDGGLPGVAITSDLFPQPPFKFFLMPMFGIDSKKFRFFGELRYLTDIKSHLFDKAMFSFSSAHFGTDVDPFYGFRDHFVKYSPGLRLRMKSPKPYSHVTSWWQYRYVHIDQKFGVGLNIEPPAWEFQNRSYGIHELSFQLSSDTVLMPFLLSANAQSGNGFLRLNVHYNQHFRGKDKLKGLWVHGFAGWLPYYKSPSATTYFTLSGTPSSDYFSTDYMYDEWLPGRNAYEGNVARQIFMKDAFIKTRADGISEKWMLGGGVSYALPLKVIHVYAGASYFHDAVSQKPILSYSGGLSIVLMKDVFEIYVPVFNSKAITENLKLNGHDQWHERITFQANFKMANPLYLLDRYQYSLY